MEALAVKLEHLKKIRYVCKCDTCQQIFFETTYDQLPAVFPHQQVQPTKWYVRAGLHWLETGKEHQIRIRLISETESLNEILLDISAKWHQDLSAHPEWTDPILKKELETLERIAK